MEVWRARSDPPNVFLVGLKRGDLPHPVRVKPARKRHKKALKSKTDRPSKAASSPPADGPYYNETTTIKKRDLEDLRVGVLTLQQRLSFYENADVKSTTAPTKSVKIPTIVSSLKFLPPANSLASRSYCLDFLVKVQNQLHSNSIEDTLTAEGSVYSRAIGQMLPTEADQTWWRETVCGTHHASFHQATTMFLARFATAPVCTDAAQELTSFNQKKGGNLHTFNQQFLEKLRKSLFDPDGVRVMTADQAGHLPVYLKIYMDSVTQPIRNMIKADKTFYNIKTLTQLMALAILTQQRRAADNASYGMGPGRNASNDGGRGDVAFGAGPRERQESTHRREDVRIAHGTACGRCGRQGGSNHHARKCYAASHTDESRTTSMPPPTAIAPPRNKSFQRNRDSANGRVPRQVVRRVDQRRYDPPSVYFGVPRDQRRGRDRDDDGRGRNRDSSPVTTHF